MEFADETHTRALRVPATKLAICMLRNFGGRANQGTGGPDDSSKAGIATTGFGYLFHNQQLSNCYHCSEFRIDRNARYETHPLISDVYARSLRTCVRRCLSLSIANVSRIQTAY